MLDVSERHVENATTLRGHGAHVGGVYAIDGRGAIVEFGQIWVGFEFPHSDRLGRDTGCAAMGEFLLPLETLKFPGFRV